MTTAEIIQLCRDCAAQVYGTRAPSTRYAESVARLLMGTAATESHFRWRRQHGFSDDRVAGAWGLWQTEAGAVSDSVRYMRKRRDVYARASVFVYGNTMELAELMDARPIDRLRAIKVNDRLAVLFARLHYLRKPEAVPDDLRGQAGYYKKNYNTVAGKGSVTKYMADWQRLVEPEL